MKEFARPSVIVGTTNFDEFLADPTGNRRFWVVPIKTSWIPLEELANERDRIWATATHAFLKGETWTLPTELKQQAIEAGQDYEMSDPWEEEVLNYIEGKTRVSASEILINAIGLDLDRQDRASQMRVTNILKANFWTTSREAIRGKRIRFWSPPEPEENSPGTPSNEGSNPSNGTCPTPPISEKNEAENQSLPNLPNLFPKTSGTQDLALCRPSKKTDSNLQPGDKVEILAGRFSGMRVYVKNRKQDGRIEVKHPNWAVTRFYEVGQLRLVKKGGQSDANAT